MLLYSYNKDIFHDYTIYKSIINFSIILFKTEKEAYYIHIFLLLTPIYILLRQREI